MYLDVICFKTTRYYKVATSLQSCSLLKLCFAKPWVSWNCIKVPHLQRCQGNGWHCFQATAVWPPSLSQTWSWWSVILLRPLWISENPWKPTIRDKPTATSVQESESRFWSKSRDAIHYNTVPHLQASVRNHSAKFQGFEAPFLIQTRNHLQTRQNNQGTSHRPSSPWSHGGCLVQMAANSSMASLAIDRPDKVMKWFPMMTSTGTQYFEEKFIKKFTPEKEERCGCLL